jgi:hypothetical protein
LSVREGSLTAVSGHDQITRQRPSRARRRERREEPR